MNARIERIPVPAAQRWESLRERTLPAAILMATIAACGWLWKHQGRIAPYVHGEVGVEVVVIRSPADGELLRVETNADGQWPLFAKVDRGTVAARLKPTIANGSTIDIPTPVDGNVTKVVGLPGQWVAKGDTILEISSATPTFIVCQVPDTGAALPAVGTEVAVRLRGNGNRWAAAEIKGISPVVTSATVYDGGGTGAQVRGLPIRIGLPKSLRLLPGALVDVRFPPGGAIH